MARPWSARCYGVARQREGSRQNSIGVPVDCIKIDGSFITEMLNNKIDRAMVEMIVHVAKVMGKSTVAEFVESDEILEALREIGVDYAQGYAIGKPSPFEAMYPLLADARLEVA
jgi:EAL domain-containing protein (putative c-di-GMP-specific phosphodiesterase class I)